MFVLNRPLRIQNWAVDSSVRQTYLVFWPTGSCAEPAGGY
jgi:hypothetical protein